MTFKQFKASGILIPWGMHCAMWGIDTENEDMNERVISYANGLYINQKVHPDGEISYVAYYDNQEVTAKSRNDIEILFWSAFAKYEFDAISIEIIQEKLENAIGPVFQELLDKNNCSGDVSPENRVILDASTNSIATIILKMLKENKL